MSNDDKKEVRCGNCKRPIDLYTAHIIEMQQHRPGSNNIADYNHTDTYFMCSQCFEELRKQWALHNSP